ncbi:MAG TPA: SPOR domain-containing protein [Bacteroidota bacterium]|jgi:cell division protein FtsN
MNVFKPSLVLWALVALLLAGGCSGSKESSAEKGGSSTVQSPSGQNPAGGPAKSDTFDVKVDNTSRPAYEPSSPSGQASGFAVQVGAYQKQDNADRVAALARERFSVSVNTYYDRTSYLYKVLVGSFATKDDARKFRDEMLQKYPGDYKDAWTTDIPQK